MGAQRSDPLGLNKARYGIIEPGLVRGPLREQFGDYPGMVKQLLESHLAPGQFDVASIVTGAALPPPMAFKGYIIMGSVHGVCDGLPWFPALAEWIRQVAAHKIPLVGICFGHQAIAQALGGEVGRSPGGWSVGVCDYQLVHSSAGGVVSGYAFHQDQVLESPPAATTILNADNCPLAGFVYEHAPIFSVQFHPEFGDAYARRLLEVTAGKSVPQDVADGGLASLGRPVYRERFARAIAAALTGAHEALVVEHLAKDAGLTA
ncbi:MAG: type 1 glutamine amidotransferase [Pseudomonadota bacterium]